MRGSVLVIGAGIAGMRATTELLQHGFKVYLANEEAEIGGRVASWDILFPTKEHTACALQPLTQMLAGSPDVTILTSAEIISLNGAPGEFRVEVSYDQPGPKTARQTADLVVGAVIVAIGLEEEKEQWLERFGYGIRPNVFTIREFEQKLSELGSGGSLTLGNGREAQRVVWIVTDNGSPSSFIAAAAGALTFLERQRNSNASILFEQALPEGGAYEEYSHYAEERGVHFMRTSSTEVDTTDSGTTILTYVCPEGSQNALEADVLVLSTEMLPGEKTAALAEKLGIELGEAGFGVHDSGRAHPILTSREGVFTCGAMSGAQTVAESVIHACAAASHAAVLLSSARGTEVVEPESVLFTVNADDDPRIAVVIDEGDEDIKDVLDLTDITEYVRTLSGVEAVEVTPDVYDGTTISTLLKSREFNRLVVAGPSPVTHEALFQSYTESAGLNRFLVEMVNLHNHCARVHSENKTQATEKAKTLMKIGVARASRLEALDDLKVTMTQSCLVIGGSPSGIACASQLAAMGFAVHLVDGEADLEGTQQDENIILRQAFSELRASSNVTVHTETSLGNVTGRVGSFTVELVKLDRTESVTVGAIVMASSTAICDKPEENGVEASLALERGEDGFYLSTEGVLNPLDFTTAGVFSCGPARAAMEGVAAVVDGEAAASRVACLLSRDEMIRSPVISSVVDANCDGCAYCVDPCPTRSITLLEFMRDGQVKKTVEVSEETCIGCGICMATCPKEGIDVQHFKLDTFSSMVKAALEDKGPEGGTKPVIVSFCCNRCAYPGADAAGQAGHQYPASVRIIRTVCTGMIHPNIMTDALLAGADGVLLAGCHPGECRSREGILRAQARAEAMELLLEDFGLEQERFRLELIAASEGRKFARTVEEMTEELVALGPSPYRPNTN